MSSIDSPDYSIDIDNKSIHSYDYIDISSAKVIIGIEEYLRGDIGSGIARGLDLYSSLPVYEKFCYNFVNFSLNISDMGVIINDKTELGSNEILLFSYNSTIEEDGYHQTSTWNDTTHSYDYIIDKWTIQITQEVEIKYYGIWNKANFS
jgi:hypothetical protein